MSNYNTPTYKRLRILMPLLLLTFAAMSANADFVRVASDGDVLSGGATLLDFGLPILNNAGAILVQARFDVDGDGGSDGLVLLKYEENGSMIEIARTGDPLPSGGTLLNFNTGFSSAAPFLSDNGRAAFQVIKSDLSGQSIVTGIGGSLIELITDGDPAPASTTGEVVSNLGLMGYTDSGEFIYLFKPYRPGVTGPQEFWRNAERLAYHGQAFGSKTVYNFTRGWVSETGDLLVSGSVQNFPDPDYTAWFRPFAGELLLVLDETFDAPSGGTFNLDLGGVNIFYNPLLNVGFGSYLDGAPVTADHGAYFHGGTSPVELLLAGDPAVGGGTYLSVNPWDINGSNDSLIWANRKVVGQLTRYDILFKSTSSGTKTAIASRGDPDPLNTGVLGGFYEGVMNDTGRVAYLGHVRVASTNHNTLFRWDGQALSTLAQEGQLFDGHVLTKVDFAGRVGSYINRSALNASGQIVFLADGPLRKAVYRFDPAGASDVPLGNVAQVHARIESVYPNPFNPRTTLVYSLATKAQITLTVHDLAGRRVRTLVSGAQLAGQHRVEWDGTDDRGRSVASGAYLCRMSSGPDVKIVRVVLLK